MFDMDGVLIDSEPAHLRATRAELASRDLPIPDETRWERIFFGRPDRDGLAEWFVLHGIAPDIPSIMAGKLTRFTEHFTDLVESFADGQWLARALHERGVPLALVTGARRAEAELVLDHFELRDVFRITVTSDETTSGKPDPQPYLLGAELLGVPADRCVVIEDAVPGLRAAEACGAWPIVVDRLGRPERFETITPVAALDDAVLAAILKRWRPT